MKGAHGLVALLAAFPIQLLLADTAAPGQREYFESHIRPVLVKYCYECHSEGAEKIGAGLLLDSWEGMKVGGESGAPVIAGEPGKSLLIHALKYENDLEMPPEAPLPEAVVNRFAEWIRMGAPDPRQDSGASPKVAEEKRQYQPGELWSFEPVKDPDLPEVADTEWTRSEADRFVLARIEQEGLSMAGDASPRVLLKRLHFDLTGLLPTRDELLRFERDFSADRENAISRKVDELLASPQFGERWGRHWLDVARYAESNGNDGLSRNPTFPHAWRYRDYVIDSFNRDVPYDRFLREQIAGDLLEYDTPEEHDRNVVATGFLALGAKPAKAMNKNFEMDVVADQLGTIGSGIMGVSIGCARCHDHKFDPISLRDYYALAGIFTSTETMWGLAGNEKLTAPPTALHVLITEPNQPPPSDFVETVILRESDTGQPKKIPEAPWPAGTPLAMGARDVAAPQDTKINQKGEATKLGDCVPRGVPVVYEESGIEGIAIATGESGRRDLAEWLTSGNHPQTARVMVNRIWLHLFGRGLVNTPDDFGVYGERPTHPELLDHLASRFVKEGWSVKSLVRYLVLSRTYRLDSNGLRDSMEQDPMNLMLSHQNRRRMDAESLRDNILASSGGLDPERPEGSIVRHRDILVNLASDLHEPNYHRSVYLCYLRNSPPPELAAFDLPDFMMVTGKRETSILPGHALFLYNNPFVIEQASELASYIRARVPEKGDEQIRSAFRHVLLRDPGEEEIYRARELLNEVAADVGSREKSFSCFCQALFATNEFRYVD